MDFWNPLKFTKSLDYNVPYKSLNWNNPLKKIEKKSLKNWKFLALPETQLLKKEISFKKLERFFVKKN